MATTVEAPGIEAQADSALRPAEVDASERVPADRLTQLIAGGDHKTTGRLYIGFSLIFGVLGLGATAAFQASGASSDWANSLADSSFQLFTLGRFLVIFGFVVPLFVGLATVVAPLQVGSRTVAFPRAASGAFWLWLVTTSMLCICYFSNGGVAGGNQNGQMLALFCLGAMVVSLLLGSLCVAVTILTMRTPNMAMDEVPLFSWAFVVATSVWVVTLTVWLGNLVLIFVDVRYGDIDSFGRIDSQWGQLAWLFTPPQVFAFVIPALGIAGDAMATLSGGARIRSRGIVLGAIGAFGFLSIGAWAQPQLVKGVYNSAPATLQVAALLVPILMLIGAYVYNIRGGHPRLASPLLAGLCALVLLAIASVGALLYVISNFALQTSPSAVTEIKSLKLAAVEAAPVYTWGVLLMVAGAALTAAIGGLYLWSTKITGRSLPDGSGKLFALVAVIAALLSAVPFLILGFANNAPDLASSLAPIFGASMAGVAALAVVVVIVGLVQLVSMQRPVSDAADPWGSGPTLEWLAPSPPPAGNFAELPLVGSSEPLLDLAEASPED